MARIVFGTIITDIRGRIGGQTFSRNGSGNYVKNQAAVNNFASPNRTIRRNLVQFFSRQWATIGPFAQSSWNTFAQTVTFTRPGDGSVYSLSGFNCYQKYNQIAALGQYDAANNVQDYTGLPLFTLPPGTGVPPLSLSWIGAPTITTGSPDVIDLANSLDFGGTAVLPASWLLIIKASPVISPGRKNFSNNVRFIQTFPGGTDFSNPQDIGPTFDAIRGSLPSTGRIGFSVGAIDLDTAAQAVDQNQVFDY